MSSLRSSREEAIVAVMGDLGRSPRMINHALELMKRGYFVNLIGYEGDIEPVLRNSIKCKSHFVKCFDFNALLKRFPSLKLPIMALKMILLSFSLLLIFVNLLLFRKSQKLMIIQTPPVMPLLILAPLFCLISGCKLIVDWHNFGYTLIDQRHWLVRRIYEFCERGLARLCGIRQDWLYICVSRSMRSWILNNFHTRPHQVDVLYDRPNEKYLILSESERRKERERFFNRFNIQDRNAILFVSSTSWTPDEDFSVLLEAIVLADKALQASRSDQLQKVVFFITGKGPLRKAFELKIQELQLQFFDIMTVWLEAETYPKLLAAADLGISLHTSSSGVDLPMKIIDMLGSGLPVCAYYYECLLEITEKRKFGYIFRDAIELGNIMASVADGRELLALKNIRDNIRLNPLPSWSQEWSKWYNKFSK